MRWYVALVTLATFVLLIAGGLVTSTDSGLAVPDWPLSYGTFFPPMVGGIRFEHTHRMIAGIVGLLALILAVWLQRVELRRWVRGVGWGALGVVTAQALLGGAAVLLKLPQAVSIAHAVLAQTFFCLIVTLLTVTSPRWRTPPAADCSSSGRWLGLAITVLLYLQLILGAILRHADILLAVHTVTALLVFALTTVWAMSVLPARWLAALVIGQIVLGVWTWWSHRHPLVATAHVVTGALLLAGSLRLTLLTARQHGAPSLRPYLELTKPRLTLLAVMTVVVGFYLGAQGRISGWLLTATALGAWLVASGAHALNQYLEQDVDALMERTRRRPLPTGRLTPRAALQWGVLLSVGGLLVLVLGVNGLTTLLAAITLLTYLLIYTPLKRRSALCTLVGAVPGALPPLMGWAAARGTLAPEAWVLFGILFLWQLPHFLALGWIYREDYRRAGLPLLPIRQITPYLLALLPLSLLPSVLGMTGVVYFLGALALSVCFLTCGLSVARWRSALSAQRLFRASLAYLPALLCLMSVDKIHYAD